MIYFGGTISSIVCLFSFLFFFWVRKEYDKTICIHQFGQKGTLWLSLVKVLGYFLAFFFLTQKLIDVKIKISMKFFNLNKNKK
jgi:hypothetical protein